MSNDIVYSFTTFGDLLRHLRRRARLTQRELGLAVGYSEAQIGRLESGQRFPDLTIVKTQFIEALDLVQQPESARRLIELASTSREFIQTPQPKATDKTLFNLPVPLTQFLGRGAEIATTLAQLNRVEVRLITLLGPPGVGKTRLAIEVAHQASLDLATTICSDGVCFVALGSITDPGLIVSAIAQALGMESAQGNALASVKLHLRDKQMLLVLDNFEHVLDGMPTVTELLATVPRLKVLTTSRVMLRVSGEFVIEVQPVDDLTALALLVARGEAAKSGFTLTSDNRAILLDICRRVDRLPLAIELVAARLRMFSPNALLAQLTQTGQASAQRTLDVMADGPRDLPARQRSLRNTIAWSFDLLNTSEQHLLRTLGIFADGFSAQAVRAVTGNQPTFDVDLRTLLDGSLVQSVEDTNGELRFSLLAMIREFALEQLIACNELETAYREHFAFYHAWVWATAPDVLRHAPTAWLWTFGADLTPARMTWTDQLERDYSNLRVALTWSLGSDGDTNRPAHDVERGAELALWLHWMWLINFPLIEATLWSERAVRSLPRMPMSILRARLLISYARSANFSDNRNQAREAAEEALEIAQRLEVDGDVVYILYTLSDIAKEGNQLVESQALCEQTLAAARDTNDDWHVVSALFNLGEIFLCQKDFVRAEQVLLESLQLYPGTPYIMQNLLGNLACYRADYPSAEEWCRHALAGFRKWGWSHGVATALHSLGDIALFAGDETEALQHYQEALQIYGETYNRQRAVWCLTGLAAALAFSDPFRAVTLWTAAESIRSAIGNSRPAMRCNDYRAQIETATATFDANARNAAEIAGRTMSFEQAVVFGLRTVEVTIG